MYKFVTITGSCGSAYDIDRAERAANDMASNGYDLVQVYQSTTPGCFGANSALVMVFRQR